MTPRRAAHRVPLRTPVRASVRAGLRAPWRPQAGAALLAAMLLVALVATLAAGAMWQQWRITEVESLERERAQATWLLGSALDWARVILREDARADGNNAVDHLAESWAVPLQQARLSEFLSAMGGTSNNARNDDAQAERVLLSGRITDAQGKLNLLPLAATGVPDPLTLRALQRLFDALGLAPGQMSLLVQGLQASAGTGDDAPLAPRHLAQLGGFGLTPATLAALAPHVTLLPVATPVNVNTVSAEVLYATTPRLGLAQARQLVQQRASRYWHGLTEFNQSIGLTQDDGNHSVNTRFFEVLGILQTDHLLLHQRSLVQRDGSEVKVIWRQADPWASQEGYTPFVQ